MKIIDDILYSSLGKMRQAYATNKEMAAALGLSATQISHMLRRKVSHFNNETWQRIKPRLMPFVEEELKRTTCKGCPRAESCLFKVIVKNLLSIPAELQADVYEDVNEYILKQKRIHRKGSKDERIH